MNLPLILRPEAEADLRDIYQSMEATQMGLGDRFIAILHGSRDVMTWKSRMDH